VACAQGVNEIRVLRERQRAPRRDDLIALDDDRPVVERREGSEDRDQKRRDDGRVEDDSGLIVVREPRGPLEDHQGTDPLLSHGLSGRDDGVDRLLLLELHEGPQEAALTDLPEQTSDVVLEEDDEDDGPDALEARHDPVQRVELEPAGDEADDHDHEEANQHLHRATAAKEQQEVVRHEGDDRDVDDVDQDSWAGHRIELRDAPALRRGRETGLDHSGGPEDGPDLVDPQDPRSLCDRVGGGRQRALEPVLEWQVEDLPDKALP
jgi:hypothetical protein